MSIDAISSSGSGLLVQPANDTIVRPAAQDADGDHDGSVGRAHGHHHGGGLAKGIRAALAQFGLDGSATAGGSGTSTTDSTANAQNTQQAFRTFVHQLFQAIRGNGGSQDPSGTTASGGVDADGDHDGSGTAAAQAGYGNLASRIQSLAQTLMSGNTQSGAVGALNTDFQNLVQAAGGSTSSTGTSGSTPDLRSFLQTLVQNLGSQSSNPSLLGALGSAIDTTA